MASDGPAKASFARTMAAVFWSFFGVRRRSDSDRDAASLNPVAVVVAALLGVALLVAALLLIVHSVVH